MRMPFIGPSSVAAGVGVEEELSSTLVKIRLPRQSERTLQSVRNMLAAFGNLGTFSLELVGDADGIRLMARCGPMGATSFRRGLVGYYPQTLIEEVRPDDDPMLMLPGERAWSRTLRVSGHEALPLLSFEDDLRMPGTDPILGILGAMASMDAGERAIARLVLTGKEHGWAEQYMAHAMTGVGSANQQAYDAMRQQEGPRNQSAGAPIVLLPIAAVGMIGLNVYNSWNTGDILRALLIGGGSLAASLVGGYVYFRYLRPKRPVYLDPAAVERRVSGAVFDAEVNLHVVQGPGGGDSRAKVVLNDLASAYSHYDNPLGSRFDIGDIERTTAEQMETYARLEGAAEVPTGLAAFKMLLPSGVESSVMGSLEAASLWHPPSSEDEVRSMERMTARTLMPGYKKVENGAFVGTDKSGEAVLLPEEVVNTHHFYVARTRMGKSTLMRHLVEYRMQEKAAGRNDDAIVVIDPHSDLVHGLMELCPPEIADQVRVIDLGDPEKVVGINLLDTQVFSDRDVTCDGIVRVAKGLWDNWGGRMQNILEHLAKSMHEANRHGGWPRSEQYTILDGHDMLGIGKYSRDSRNRMLDVIRDPYLKRWWRSEFGSWDNRLKVEACAPVQTRLAYYASSEKARRVLGQPESTLDIRQTIQDGGILLVASAQAYVGRDVASLIGACILNLVDAVIRNQGTLPEEDRRGCLVVVDEMQSIPGVDYEGMLSEVGKFGGSLVLATQSLTKLDELSMTMRDTILANVGCLAAFQVSGHDAQRIRGELGADRVEEHDIVSLPRHECYLKMSSLAEGVSTMSMRVRPPSEGSALSLDEIEKGMFKYTKSVDDVDMMLAARVDAATDGEIVDHAGRLTFDDPDSDDGTPDVAKPSRPNSSGSHEGGMAESRDTVSLDRQREVSSKDVLAAERGGGEDGTTDHKASNL